MTSSSNPAHRCGLDTMLLVYSLLPGHPAEIACEHLLRSHLGWFTSTFVLVEAKNILLKVYRVDPVTATAKLLQLAGGPLDVFELDPADIAAAFMLVDHHGLDFTDATLLGLSSKHGANSLATEDQRLSKACVALGIQPVSPIDSALRQRVIAWETANLPSKGLPRILR